jgi:hypothetical protein
MWCPIDLLLLQAALYTGYGALDWQRACLDTYCVARAERSRVDDLRDAAMRGYI